MRDARSCRKNDYLNSKYFDMDKMKIDVREFVNRFQVNCDRIKQIADVCEKEQRERNKKEDAEYETLVRENHLLQMRMQAAAAEFMAMSKDPMADVNKIVRENKLAGKPTEFIFVRDMMMVSDAKSGGIVPLNVQDILKPLQEGFILDKVGLPLLTGLVGEYVWPVYEAVTATVAGEGVAITAQKINMSALRATPDRVGLSTYSSNQALNASDGLVEKIVRETMPQAVRALLNKILFSTKKVNNATQLVGPFVDKVDTAVPLSKVPTFEELNKGMKAKVLESGVDGEHLCWVMTKSMQAILEGQPINKDGVFLPMIQNGMLCGLPVYTTNEIRVVDKSGGTIKTTEYIGLGDWRYQPMGLFGDLRFIVDPFTAADKDAVTFHLNADYSTKTLSSDAFILGKVAP